MRIPLFPLGTVLFPGGWLPLQIFEVRYLDMVQRCRREGQPFGVVCLSEGQEVRRLRPNGQGPAYESVAFHPIGTLADIVEFEQLQPGLLRIGCIGTGRFRILESEQLPHGLWMAEVEPIPADRPTSIPEELHPIVATLRQLHERLRRDQPDALGPTTSSDSAASTWQDAGWVSDRWAELLPLPAASKQQLLALESPLLRLELVGDALEQLGIVH
jgi:uncharacterized protein